MKLKPIPSQEEADLNDPEEHFLWALRNLPMVAGSGLMTFSGYLRGWSKHLWECGFVHRSYLEGKADEDGNIHVSSLPEQRIHFREPFRGPHHTWNPAGRWAKPKDPEPEPARVPNIDEMTIQEQHALLYQFQQKGMIPKGPAGPAGAEVVKE